MDNRPRPLSLPQHELLARAIDANGGPKAFAAKARVSVFTLGRAMSGHALFHATTNALLSAAQSERAQVTG